MSEWQDINTAPTDGTVILVYADQGPWNGVHSARPHYSGRKGAYGHVWAHANHQNLGEFVSGFVTHWMSLPHPPSSPTDSENEK